MLDTVTQPRWILKISAISGIVAPILTTVLWIAAGLLRPGYDHLTQYGSELTAGSNGVLMQANIALLGLLSLILAPGLHRGVNEGKGSIIGPVLLGIFGSGTIVAGIFPCDPGCPESGSLSQNMHNAFSVVSFVSLMLTPSIMSRRLKKNSFWAAYRSYSLVTTIVAMILFFTLFSVPQLVGLWQRLFLGVLLLWMEIIAIHLSRISV